MVVKQIIILFLFSFYSSILIAQKQYSVLAGTSSMKGLAMSISFEKPFKTVIDTTNELVEMSKLIFASTLNYENNYLMGSKYNSYQLNLGLKRNLLNGEKKSIELYYGLQNYVKYMYDQIILNNKNKFSFGIKPSLEFAYIITPRTSFILKYEYDIVLINKEFGNNYYLLTGFKIKI
jgi:hypothetical protein